MRVLKRGEIAQVIEGLDPNYLLMQIEKAFVAIALNQVNMPPIGHLGFDSPPGDVHIKYGHITGDASYVIKIGSGFPQNSTLGLSNSNGLMLAFKAQTGELEAALLDEGYLTDQRTAIAGAVVAKHMAPGQVEGIGIVGTGIQARMQLEWLKTVTACRKVYVSGRSSGKMDAFIQDMSGEFTITACETPAVVAAKANLIVTTTNAKSPLLMASDVRPGTHITAMGSDTPGKQELDENILAASSIVACDSISQCMAQGEACHAVGKGVMSEDQLTTVGAVIHDGIQRKDEDITVADLTGIATQDIKISLSVLEGLSQNA
jgi:ornithine cyclodeaminase